MNTDAREWMSAWLRDGDEAAARALMAAFYPFVAALIRRHAGDANAVEDLAQATFVRLFASARRWDSAKPLEPWLARIAINVCRNHFAATQRRREVQWDDLSEGERTALESPEPVPDVLADDARALMLRVLATLSADDRLVLTLLHLEGKATGEIAALTGWSRVRVKVRAFRARQKLRAAFEKLESTRT